MPSQQKLHELLADVSSQDYEKRLRVETDLIAGTDEVGRGCLVGPVVAAAVILPPSYHLDGLKDSKLLSAVQRERLFEGIVRQAVSYAVSFVDSQEIDVLNILQASLKAMRQAIESLSCLPEVILVDGNHKIPFISIPQKTVIKGDLHCPSIAAASIVAKVSRDRWMLKLEQTYPGYGFAQHKGYPTLQHRRAIQALGPTSFHRRSFRLTSPSAS